MTLPISLEAAAGLGPDIDKRLLYREHRAGRWRAFKLGGRLFTSSVDIQDWMETCLGKSSRPASTSDKEDRPDGSSGMAPANSAQATAQNIAKMLQRL